ncbi:hypothetical protein MSAN_00475200 [Mycena sanguinolenta]|uniref:Uncharacterized protein n=1 Tax=Mycena sanguinolenta TaxID=230812 RepID=A0A8H7DLQ7_9AGAR|nr:hypothetical protein MSAN_00475200 [Mycena sanguinolenta]
MVYHWHKCTQCVGWLSVIPQRMPHPSFAAVLPRTYSSLSLSLLGWQSQSETDDASLNSPWEKVSPLHGNYSAICRHCRGATLVVPLPLPSSLTLSLAIFIPLTLLAIARGMSWVSLWIFVATLWAAGAAGLSINMTSAHNLPAGGTAVFVWAQDNLTANPDQFTLYIVPEGPEENVVDEQLVNAGVQLSGTVTMVVPPNTPTGVYQTLAYTGTDGPTVGTGPALWGDEIELVAAASSGGSSQSSTGSLSSAASQPSSTALQTSTSASTLPTSPLSQSLGSSASSGVGGGGASSTNSPNPGQTTSSSKHELATGAIVGIVLALILALLAIGVLLFYLRRRRQRARRRFSGIDTNHPLDPSLPVPVVTPFTSPTTTLQIPIREKDAGLGSSKPSPLSASDSASASGSSANSRLPSDSEQQQAIERLEREVQTLRAQQQLQAQSPVLFDNVPPPLYETL